MMYVFDADAEFTVAAAAVFLLVLFMWLQVLQVLGLLQIFTANLQLIGSGTDAARSVADTYTV